MNLEGKAHLTAVLHSLDCLGVGIGESTEFVVLGFIKAVKADSHGLSTSILQFLGDFLGNEHSVGTEYRTQSLGGGVGYQFVDVGTKKGFSTTKNHNLKSSTSNLIDEFLSLGCSQFLFLCSTCILITVAAFQIAFIGSHPRYNH